MAITMARDLEKTGNPINIIHGDNDSTTKFRLQADFPYVEKRDDTNHTKKSITIKLYKSRQKYKVLRQPNVISYIISYIWQMHHVCHQRISGKGSRKVKNVVGSYCSTLVWGSFQVCQRKCYLVQLSKEPFKVQVKTYVHVNIEKN